MKFIDIKTKRLKDEKEYVVYRNTIGGYQKNFLTREELKDYINQNHLTDLDIYKTNDIIKIKRTLEIEEK